MSRKIIFFDFDETLYSHKTRGIPASAREALRGLHAGGHVVVIATGRGPESMAFIQQQLPCPCDTLILLNGQLIYRNGRKIYERFITLPSLNAIIETARKNGFAYGGYCENGEIVDHVNERVAAVWKDFDCPIPTVRERFELQYSLYQGHLYITRKEAQFMKELLDDYILNWSHEYLVNLISKEAGKSRGVRWLMQESGIPIERAYAFGDGFNDKDMLQAVGHGIAMGNASDEIKREAEHVTDDIHEDGVLHALQFYNLL